MVKLEDTWAYRMGALAGYPEESLQEYHSQYSSRLLELENQLLAMLSPSERELFEEYVELSAREASSRANIYFSHGYHAGIKDAPFSSYNERLNKYLQEADVWVSNLSDM